MHSKVMPAKVISAKVSKIVAYPMLAFIILVLGIGCDQASKSLASQILKGSPSQSYLGQSVILCYALNPGGFLSLGGNLSPQTRQSLFIGANGLLLTGILGFLIFKGRQVSTLIFASLNLILAGGIGNMIDRVFNQGLVTDFIVLRLGPLQTGVFNVADVAISVGTLGIALSVFLSVNSTEPSPDSTEETADDLDATQ